MDENELTAKLAELLFEAKKPDYLGDTIKIGLPLLGTIVVAVLGYLASMRAAASQRESQLKLAQLGHAAELNRDYQSRRADRFSRLLEKMDNFSQALTTHTTSIKNYIDSTSSGGAVPAAQLAVIEERENKFSDSFLFLLSAEAQLLTSGDEAAAKMFREYGESAQAAYKEIHKDNSSLTVGRVQDLESDLREKRRELLIRIGETEKPKSSG